MGGGGMSKIRTYTLRDATPEALHATLLSLSAGRTQGLEYAFAGACDDGSLHYAFCRVRAPFPETTAGAPMIDPDTGEPYTPQVQTGNWLAQVFLVEPDEDEALAAISIDITTTES